MFKLLLGYAKVPVLDPAYPLKVNYTVSTIKFLHNVIHNTSPVISYSYCLAKMTR